MAEINQTPGHDYYKWDRVHTTSIFPVYFKYAMQFPSKTAKELALHMINDQAVTSGYRHTYIVMCAVKKRINRLKLMDGNLDHPEPFKEYDSYDAYQKAEAEYNGKSEGRKRKVVEESAPSEAYSVSEGSYIIENPHGELQVSVENMDAIFYEYSNKGLNMTSTEIRQKYNLSVWEWIAIKRSLSLYKESDIFSPYTVDNTPRDEYQAMVEDKMEYKLKDRRRLIEAAYVKTNQKHYKHAIDQMHKRQAGMDELKEGLALLLPKVDFSPLPRDTSAHDESNEVVVAIADLHIGSKVDKLNATPSFDNSILRTYLAHLAEEINVLGAAKVHLAFLGDMIESFTGLNHKNSWKSMAHGAWGAPLIKEAVDIVVEFMSKVNNVESVYAVPGNHDRSTASKDEDDTGEIADIIFWAIGNVYPGINVRYDKLAVSQTIEGIRYIFTHGHERSADDSKMLFAYGDTSRFNVILTGHLHTRAIKADSGTHRWIQCPSVFTGNWYSERSGWTSTSGALILWNHRGTGLPTVYDVPLSGAPHIPAAR